VGSIGAPEILLLAIFALIFFGPKRLPEIGRQVGRAIAEVRRVSRDFEREVRDATEPFEREIREAERVARDTYTLDDDHSRYVPDDVDREDEPAALTDGDADPKTKQPD
jgi:TatA/E family protein of Tat protein translocase